MSKSTPNQPDQGATTPKEQGEVVGTVPKCPDWCHEHLPYDNGVIHQAYFDSQHPEATDFVLGISCLDEWRGPDIVRVEKNLQILQRTPENKNWEYEPVDLEFETVDSLRALSQALVAILDRIEAEVTV